MRMGRGACVPVCVPSACAEAGGPPQEPSSLPPAVPCENRDFG